MEILPLAINTEANTTAEIFGLERDVVNRLIPAISEIFGSWERTEIKAGVAIGEAARLGSNTQEVSFCLVTIAAAMERTRLMTEAVRVARSMNPVQQAHHTMIIRKGEA